MKKIEKKSMTIWNISTVKGHLFILALAVFIFKAVNAFATKYVQFPDFVLWGIIALLAYSFTESMLANYFGYKNTRYELSDEMFYHRTGTFGFVEINVPLERIQHVNLGQTFLSRFFNLYYLEVYTAGDVLNISFVSEEEAELLRKTITDKLIQGGLVDDTQAQG